MRTLATCRYITMPNTRAHFNCRCASERILTAIAPTAGINRTAELLLHRALTQGAESHSLCARKIRRVCARFNLSAALHDRDHIAPQFGVKTKLAVILSEANNPGSNSGDFPQI